MQDAGCVAAIDLDGGGSTTYAAKGRGFGVHLRCQPALGWL
ncbi:MAG: phosphodiester glycosidase family protein [Oscillospiraceae bacterium]